jgi:hypothetical protein
MKFSLLIQGNKKLLKRVVIIGVICIILASIITIKLQQRNHPSAQAQMKALVAEVSKIIELPTNETPTTAIVTDDVSIKKQPFFIHAKKGDKVLIYANNKLAILYRPSAHKIINVGPINGTVSYAKTSVTVRNGTTSVAFTNDVIGKLSSSFPNAKLAQNSPAHRTDFPKTIVIPLNDKSQDIAAQIADTIHGQVGIMPTGEDTPNTDILIIIGQDYR